jgi:hypothetical protein
VGSYVRSVDVQKVHVHKHHGEHAWAASTSEADGSLAWAKRHKIVGFKCEVCGSKVWLADKGDGMALPPTQGCYDIQPLGDRHQWEGSGVG